VNTGKGVTYVGVNGTVGNLWSSGYVDLRPNAVVNGNLTAESTVHYEPGASVTGEVKAPVALGTLRENAWTPVLPTNQSGSVALEPNTTRAIQPGTFTELSVKQNARVSIAPGIYRFGRLILEPGSRVELSSVANPTIFYVDGDVAIRGKILDSITESNKKIPLLIVSLTSKQVPVEAPFNGTLFVPNGKITLSSGAYEGAFFGKSIELSPDTVVTLHAFPFSEVLPQEQRVWSESPVSLTAKVKKDGVKEVGEVTKETDIIFTIADFLKVYQGNAGTGTATFKFRKSTGVVVTCAYVGNAPGAHPTEEIPILLGQRYRFVSCDDGSKSGDVKTATWFQLTVESGDQEALQKETVVQLHLGGGCSDTIEPAIAPVEVAALRQDFNWRTAKALPEVDPEGRRALWHGLIYIDRPEQLIALDRWRVFYDTRPITKNYNSEYHGKCGRVEHSTDGKGVLVYAIFPAKFFNLMRNVSIEALAKGREPPFKMIVPSVPNEPEHINADGSIKYSSLGKSGYGAWLRAKATQQPNWFGDGWRWSKGAVNDAYKWCKDKGSDCADYFESGFDYVEYLWNEFVDWGAEALDEAWEEIQEGLQEFVLLFEDKVTLRADFRIANLDKMFPKNALMSRAWGPPKANQVPYSTDNRPYLYPTHASFRVRQWGWGVLPTMDESEISGDGHATLELIKDESSGGSDADFCIKLSTGYAMMTTDLIPNEVCYFNDYQMYDFIEDSNELITVEQHDIMALTELRDSYVYTKDVLDVDHPRIDVLIGWTANQATTITGGRATCPCLDFPGTTATLLEGAAAVAGGANIVTQVLAQVGRTIIAKDLWWPDSDPVPARSRGVITHEYGHFNMCALMYELSPNGAADAPAMFRGLLTRLWDGETKHSEKAIMTETMADTFAFQVVGASNYAQLFEGGWYGDPKHGQGEMSFCGVSSGVPAPKCLDRNYVGKNDCYARGSLANGAEAEDFHDEICRIESLVFDAFDTSSLDSRNANFVTKGDFWQWDGTNLRFSPSAFIASSDESVAIGGAGWSNWVSLWLERGRVPNKANVLGGLVDAMVFARYNWCDVCEVLAIHSTATPVDARMTDTTGNLTFDMRNERWQACLANKTMRNLLPEPPNQYGNFDLGCNACPSRSVFSTYALVCVPCDANQISRGNKCVNCPEGQVPTSANECSGCSDKAIAVGTSCVPCAVGSTPNGDQTACVPCKVDAVIDWSSVIDASTCSKDAEFDMVEVQATNDNCPDEFWVEFAGVETLVEKNMNRVTFSAAPDESLLTASNCSSVDSHVEVWRDSVNASGSTKKWMYGDNETGTWHSEIKCGGTNICVDYPCDGEAKVVVDLTVPAGMQRLFVGAGTLQGNSPTGVFTATGSSAFPGCGSML
jgi:hypothetical protein